MDKIKAFGFAALALTTSVANAATLNIESAEDWGGSHASYPASNVIDGSLAWASRWAASGSPVNLQLNLGSVQTVTEVGVSWGKGGDQTHTFEIWARAATSGSWTKVYDSVSSGLSASIEVYDIDDIEAQQVRIKTFENSAGTSWTNIKEVEIYGAGSQEDGELTVDRAFDDGTSHSSYPPANAIDNSTAWASRWAAEAGGSAVNLTLELAEAKSVKEVGVAWGQGDSRTHTFEIYARPGTSGTWTKVHDSVSSGNTTDIERYNIDDITAQQVRVKAQSNSAGSNWMNITEVKLYGSEAECNPCGPIAEYPSDLMDNYNQWKITYPIADSDGDPVEIKQLYQVTSEYFYVNETGDGIVFYAPINDDNAPTENSTYIRSELRERTADGSSDIYWTTSGKHVVYAKQAITHLPIVKDHIVATQIHGNKSEGIDDALVLRLEGSHLFLSFNGGQLRDDLTIKTNYSLGTVHEIMFEVINGKHYVYYSEDGNLNSAYAAGNADQYLVKDGSNDYVMDRSYGDAYFKIGNYTQSNSDKEGSYTNHPDNYGEVVVYDFWVDHE
ncbi:translation initiation factor SUI1 [Saccharobesus litoralis]|uniref:Translation initiation factor SUI1 n=1 Tax=Saccharobesus litoralis TaxID=2172099 RepID=A0A2S0VPX8_9ALTE|nr:polysaccharide lyase family 7 protein [Saccharobesus litoralis]AWB66140.1 translation initiation factor SUI1 [Saccharobesus litoralis]